MPVPVFKLNIPDDSKNIQSIPIPSGSYPFHVKLSDEIAGLPSQKMVFNMVGDTGSIRMPSFQQYVAAEMGKQFVVDSPEDRPLFMYHLGDVVYNYGAEELYYDQFFKPFTAYPAPIFAIPGNHDAAVDKTLPNPPDTLEAYLKVFCNKEKILLPIAGDSGRLTMTEPNVYWVMEAPLATIIGLYTNVSKFGYIGEEQKDWLVKELKAAVATPQKAVILCLHHSPYSADSNHGSSRAVMQAIEECFVRAGVRPDVVFSGHVHNYQRFIKTYDDGYQLPFIVAGAGGYADLHTLAIANDPNFTGNDLLLKGLKLFASCDESHGFLKLSISRNGDDIVLAGEYYTVSLSDRGASSATMKDGFELILAGRNKAV